MVIHLYSKDQDFYQYLKSLLPSESIALFTKETARKKDVLLVDTDTFFPTLRDCPTILFSRFKDPKSIENPYGFPVLARPFLHQDFFTMLYPFRPTSEQHDAFFIQSKNYITEPDIPLGKIEERLFYLLKEADGKPIDKETLALYAWEKNVSNALLAVTICHLRKKLNDTIFDIRALHKQGYYLVYRDRG